MRLQGTLLGEDLRTAVLSEITISAPLAVLAAALVWRGFVPGRHVTR